MSKSAASISPAVKTKDFFKRLWGSLTKPSPEIKERDQRRQAGLLSGILLVLIIAGMLIELLNTLLTDQPHYTGYRESLAAIFSIAIIYRISRTHYIRLAAILATFFIVLAIFFTGWAQPYGVSAGLLDYLILPLWLGSLYLSLSQLLIVIIVEFAGMLLLPILTPEIKFSDVLVGPFSFIFMMSILLIVITRHRNLLEQDRNASLVEKEEESRHEAARAEALLRVAARLNAQLDLEALLTAICEEVVRALNTSTSLVALYDQKQNAFYSAAAIGLAPELLKSMSPFPKALYDETTKTFGKAFSLPNLQIYSSLPNFELLMQLNMHSLAFSTMEYEREVIGTLSAITLHESRTFTEDELLLLQGLSDQAALAITNTRLYKDAHRRLEHLQALRAIDIAIASNHDLQETLNIVLDQITRQLQVDAAVILLLDEVKQKLEFGTSRGFRTSSLRFTSLEVGEGLAGRAVQQGHVIYVRDLRSDLQTFGNSSSLSEENFVSYYAAPLIAQNQVKGVLEIFHRSILDPDEEWLGFLETLAGQAAIAVESTSLFEDLQRTNDELIKAYDATIEGWSHALDLRDKETEGHTQRVTELSLQLARTFGFPEKDLLYIRWGALLHDIGKMGVPDKILLKEGPLTAEEWDIMRQHPVYAHEMLRSIQYLRQALDIPYCHHEKWDGTGYPRGLKGEEIPLVARLFAVIDVWDALTSDRPYRAAWSQEKTLVYIQGASGQQFDPQVVKVFTGLITQKSNR